MEPEVVDVLIVGAGISGISAACHLRQHCPERSFAILEARPRLGGTWDLFRYPGVRSDSDMYTLGFAFKPWTHDRSIATGQTILDYLDETVDEQGVRAHIRFGQRVLRAAWVSAEARWTVDIQRAGDAQVVQIQCNFLFMCSGYYNYGQGHRPDFPGIERFGGQIAHPQQWPQDLNYDGKKVLIIGSGATAVTLVPAMAERAAHVTMLQRSPSYVVARPGVDKIANFLRQTLPLRWAYTLTRLKNAALGMYMLRMCRTKPERAKAFFIDQVRQALGPDYDVAKHFTPRYRPWEQRLCLVPDGDLFQAIKGGKASVMTDHIDTFTETGVTLRSGESIEAEVVVPATGLELQALAGVTVSVDGQSMDVSQAVNYKGVMYCGVPNFAVTFGYTKASWTLKADLTSLYVCRLLNHMQRTGLRRCAPRPADPAMPLQPWTEFSSGYFERALAQLPKQGSEKPWKLNQAWLPDVLALRFGSIDDGQMVFSA